MSQIHLWAPCVIDVEELENKIMQNLDELTLTFPSLELEPIQTHIRNSPFEARQLSLPLDEVMFIPIVSQIHIIFLTDYDVLPLDHTRIVDEIFHIESIARLTRRIQILVIDSISLDPAVTKTPTAPTKEGLKLMSAIINSRISVGDTHLWPHNPDFQICSGCNLLIRSTLFDLLQKIETEQSST